MSNKRDTSRDGFKNKLQTFALTNFSGVWKLLQSNDFLKRKINKTLINNAIYAIPTRPYPFSLMTMEPGFWVPPAIGPWMIKRKLLKDGGVRHIERALPPCPDRTKWRSNCVRRQTGRTRSRRVW